MVLLFFEPDRWQMTTRPYYGEMVKRILDTRRNAPLSPAALEVLAVIAYNQPVSRSFIEQVRGVDSSSTVTKLLDKGLIEEAGRLDLPGKPVAFQVTDTFLRVFGLGSLNDLPPLHGEVQEEPPPKPTAMPSSWNGSDCRWLFSLFILRLIGWILLALLVILLAALVLPLGIRVSYHPGSLQVRGVLRAAAVYALATGRRGQCPLQRPQVNRQPQRANRAPRLPRRLSHRRHRLSRQLPQPGSADTAPPEPESTPPEGLTALRHLGAYQRSPAASVRRPDGLRQLHAGPHWLAWQAVSAHAACDASGYFLDCSRR